MEKTKEPGYVYILTNPSFREDWVKIGKSSRPVNVRSKELDNTAVPLPFEIYATVKTIMYNEVEGCVHDAIDSLTHSRIRPNREFFNVPPRQALACISKIADNFDKEAVVTVYKDGKPITNNEKPNGQSDDNKRTVRRKKPPFKFSMVDIKPGESITFTPTNTEVRVASDDSIEYEGRIYKLSPFVGTFMPEATRNRSRSYDGPKYFSYKGKVLFDLRCSMESEGTTLEENDIDNDNME